MEIYVALQDVADGQSFIIGAFSTESRAQRACQEHETEIGSPGTELVWKDGEAAARNSEGYAVVLVDLDTPT